METQKIILNKPDKNARCPFFLKKYMDSKEEIQSEAKFGGNNDPPFPLLNVFPVLLF